MSQYLYALCLAGVTIYVVSNIVNLVIARYWLKRIPHSRLLGSSWPGAYYYQVFKFLINGRGVLRDAYAQHPNSAFKIPEMKGWHVVISGHDMIRDMIKASDEILSNGKAFDESQSITYTLGESVLGNPYLTDLTRGTLTRNIGVKFGEVCEEIREAFRDEIVISDSEEWISIVVSPMIRRVVFRTSNRFFVGLPLCRDPVFLNLNIDFAAEQLKAAIILDLFPSFIRPLVAPLLRACPRKIKTVVKFLEPVILERLQKEKKEGSEWDGRPNDLFSWLLDHAPEEYKTVHDMTLRILMMNLAATNTTSMTFTAALLNLAAYTEYIQPLREEIEAIVEEFGWTKMAMGRMVKLDSFLKESMRMNAISCLTATRKAIEDFTFSNGIRVPSGTFVSVAADAIHHDETIYPDHTTFNGFRFLELKKSSEGDSFKHNMVTLSPDFLLFGQGRHACPGRFFAVHELKALMAYVLLTYDIKLEDDRRVPPEPKWFGPSVLPDETSKVMFRRRVRSV